MHALQFPPGARQAALCAQVRGKRRPAPPPLPAQVPVLEVEAAARRGVAPLDVVFPVADVVSEEHVLLGVGIVLLDPAVGHRDDHVS